MYKAGQTTSAQTCAMRPRPRRFCSISASSSRRNAPEWPNKCSDCGTSRPSNKPLFFTIDARRRRELRQGRACGGRLSRQRDFAHAADHDRRSHSGGRTGRRSTRPFPVSRWRSPGRRENCSSSTSVRPAVSTTTRRAREPDAAAHREVHRRVRAGLRQQPREPAISTHQAVRRRVSQQRRRSRVLRSRSARWADPLRQAKAAASPAFTAPRSRHRICASSAS